ncbi:hypothetical protein H1W37_03600 [Stappia taiwanensis]|uniref:Uncharacterized protein n=1 Tax=Stappia taiwanensis TaxID=992267 RepID=A0A838XUR3_9HYPH|nr:hypothetical protein [Stappia taiwanensis]MBA4610723.1 hypothetical protein [Stappia taiwanensis]GGE82654.1 hypothetical protein GCM10007285_07750 [Stappia taiwanensis]
MARKASPIGPNIHALIEDARIDLARAVLAAREGENEPDFALPEGVPDFSDDEAIETFRQELVRVLAEFDQDELRPAEQRSRRILSLAEGKGIDSLSAIADQQLTDEQSVEFERQPDPLCKSIWAFLNARRTFEDAESFHFARKFRDYGKLYDAFEVELEKAIDLDSGAVDENALARKITEVLQLKTACTVKAIDLPATAAHPASIMLIVRHGGPLSSVHDHRDDGRRGTIYYRPPNEATLIYTPAIRQIEVCADSPVVRQGVAGAFAEQALGHDVSQKPLTWKRYNLSRFRSSLRLDLPRIDGYEITDARVLEAEIRLGNWRRKLLLKVASDDDIEEVADCYLRPNNIFRRADGFSRIGIAVAYNRVGDDRERTLNITISGSKSCNLQSNKDPDERTLGFALLDAWGILSAFRQIDPGDLRAMFRQLVILHNRTEDEVSGEHLRELGLDPDQLIQGGLLDRRGRQDIVLINEDDTGGEAAVKPSGIEGMSRTVDAFGKDGGLRPTADLEMFEINRDWLHETVVGMLKPLLIRSTAHVIDPDLSLLGSTRIDGAEVPIFFARRLYDLKTVTRLDQLMRARNSAGVGIVLSASGEGPGYLGPNVVLPMLRNLSLEAEGPVIPHAALELAYRTNLPLARGGATPQVLRSGPQSATVHIPGKAPLALTGADQITIFDRLVAAWKSGSPDVQVKQLMDGLGSRSPQQAFRTKTWESILNVYIARGEKRGYWRLVTGESSTEDVFEALVEERV